MSDENAEQRTYSAGPPATVVPPGAALRAILAGLERHGYKSTAPRREIIAQFLATGGALTAADLYTQVHRRSHSIGLVTVYRTLELLAEAGLAYRLVAEDQPHREAAYILCSPTQAHHHHVICTRCGRVEHLPDCALGMAAQYAAKATGYTIERHTFILYGRCPSCQTP